MRLGLLNLGTSMPAQNRPYLWITQATVNVCKACEDFLAATAKPPTNVREQVGFFTGTSVPEQLE